MPVIFVFVDGVGVGANDPDRNPLSRGAFLLSRFADGSGTTLPGGGRASVADAALGVPGRPQSATGQTALLTGENAPQVLGRHLLGYPNERLRALLAERSIFRRLTEAGRRTAFANPFPVAYLRAIGVPCEGDPEVSLSGRRLRVSASTAAFVAGGQRFCTFADARAGRALPADLTGRRMRQLGAELPERSPEEWAEILARIAAAHELTLFELFETDEAGHAQSMEAALLVLERLDRFLRALVAKLPPEGALLVTSDHGNLEDLSIRNHTRAPVPVLGFGRAAGRVDQVRDLTCVAPLLETLVGEAAGQG